MSSFNIIDCWKESCTEAFVYTFSIHNKSSMAGNIKVFEDFNVTQIGIQKRWSLLGKLTHNLVERFENSGANASNINYWY